MTVSRISPSSERETYHEAVRSTGMGSVSFTVCTMRPKGDWNTGLRACLPTVATAGGVETRDFYAAKLNGSRPVGSQLLQGGWHPLYRRHETTIKWLADVYEWHHANVCYKEGERIWLNADSAANWAVLCKKPPPSVHGALPQARASQYLLATPVCEGEQDKQDGGMHFMACRAVRFSPKH